MSLPVKKREKTMKVKIEATGRVIDVIPVTPNMTLKFYRGDDGCTG